MFNQNVLIKEFLRFEFITGSSYSIIPKNKLVWFYLFT